MGSGYWNMVPGLIKGGRGKEEKERKRRVMGSGYWTMVPGPIKEKMKRKMIDEEKMRIVIFCSQKILKIF